MAKLCQYFATNQPSFLAPGVKEAHVRQSLIAPLFEALGWDVRNASMTAPPYREVIPEDSLDNAKGETCLAIAERKRILTTHIYGVDIDRQAVKTTKLSLLLKALEGENDATLSHQMTLFQERALPKLSDNIKAAVCHSRGPGPDGRLADRAVGGRR